MDPDPSSDSNSTFIKKMGLPLAFIFMSVPFSSGLLFALLLLVMLLVFSALISGSEVAFFSLEPADINELKEDDHPAAKKVLKLKEKPRYLLATILISNNFINIGIILLSDFLVSRLFGASFFSNLAKKFQLLSPLQSWRLDQIATVLEFSTTVFSVTFLLVLFGEVAPKIYARFNNLTLAKRMAGILSALMSFLYIFSRVLVNWTHLLEHKMQNNNGQYVPNKEELEDAIELTVSGQAHADEDINLLKNIINFNEVSVRQIMCSRVDAITVSLYDTLEEVLEVIKGSGYSRIPVLEDDFDHIKGVLYAKDLIGRTSDEEFTWQEVIQTDVHYVPESKPINELLKEFQNKRQHMAIVVDEFGGSNGLITLEDIMEEVIGEISDEFDEDDKVNFTKVNEHTYIFEGKTLINDVARIMDIDLDIFNSERGEADSIAGLVLELLGQIPRLNQEIKRKDFTLKVESVNKKRVEQVKIVYTRKED